MAEALQLMQQSGSHRQARRATTARSWRRASIRQDVHGRRQRHAHHHRRVWRLRPRNGEMVGRKGARNLVMLGRSGAATPEALGGGSAICRARRARSSPIRATSPIWQRSSRLFDVIRTTMPPMAGIMHAAVVLDDAILANLDAERFRARARAEDHGRRKSRPDVRAG